MPASLIEAGLCGVPTLATDVGSIGDIVVHDETGYVVPAGDQRAFDAALARLLDDSDVRTRLGNAARARCAERFTIEAVAPTWLRVLKENIAVA